MRENKKAGVRAFTLIELLVVVAVISILVAILFPVFAGVREKGRRTACTSNMRQIEMALTAYTQDNEGQFPAASLDRQFPTTHLLDGDWSLEVLSYVSSTELFRCPTVQVPLAAGDPDVYISGTATKGYALNDALDTLDGNGNQSALPYKGLPIGRVPFPAATVALAEAGYSSSVFGHTINGPLIAYRTSSTLTAPESLGSLFPGETWEGLPGGVRHGGGSNYAFVDGHVHWYTPAQVLNSDKPNDGSQPSFAL